MDTGKGCNWQIGGVSDKGVSDKERGGVICKGRMRDIGNGIKGKMGIKEKLRDS